MLKALECEETWGVPVLLELSSPAIHCSSLTSCCDTYTVGTAVPHHMTGGQDGVCAEQ